MMKPKLKRDWIGRKVRTRYEIQSGTQNIQAGTILTVSENRSGLRLKTERCSCCGVSVYIRGVPESGVDLLPVD